MSELWFNAIIEFGAVFFGFVLAFGFNRWWERRKFEQRLEEILPTIFFEIKDNRKLLTELIDHQRFFKQTFKRFDISNWDIYRDDVSRLEPTLLIHLTKIFNSLRHLNYVLDRSPEDTKPSEPIHGSIQRISQSTRDYIDKIDERLENELTVKYPQGYERITKELQKYVHVRDRIDR